MALLAHATKGRLTANLILSMLSILCLYLWYLFKDYIDSLLIIFDAHCKQCIWIMSIRYLLFKYSVKGVFLSMQSMCMLWVHMWWVCLCVSVWCACACTYMYLPINTIQESQTVHLNNKYPILIIQTVC